MTEPAFIVSLIVLLFTYIGYPILISILALLRPQDIRRGDYKPPIAIIIVVYNECERIDAKIKSCLALDYPRQKLRILVVSDGSDDGTAERIQKYRARGVSLLEFEDRRGKAACINDAVSSCNEEILVLTDVRQRLDADSVTSLVRNFADANVGAASGELVLEKGGESGFSESISAYWRYEKFIRRQESQFHSVVGVSGAFYALRRECFRKIPTNTILDDVVIPLNVVSNGYRVIHDRVARAYDKASNDHRQEKARKIRTAAGNYQLLFAHPQFLTPLRNPIFFQYLSHKVLRLASPFCLAILFISNIPLALASTGYQTLLLGQIMMYLLSIAGSVWPIAGRVPLANIVRAFVLLNWFALLGLGEYLKNRNAHLWRQSDNS